MSAIRVIHESKTAIRQLAAHMYNIECGEQRLDPEGKPLKPPFKPTILISVPPVTKHGLPTEYVYRPAVGNVFYIADGTFRLYSMVQELEALMIEYGTAHLKTHRPVSSSASATLYHSNRGDGTTRTILLNHDEILENRIGGAAAEIVPSRIIVSDRHARHSYLELISRHAVFTWYIRPAGNIIDLNVSHSDSFNATGAALIYDRAGVIPSESIKRLDYSLMKLPQLDSSLKMTRNINEFSQSYLGSALLLVEKAGEKLSTCFISATAASQMEVMDYVPYPWHTKAKKVEWSETLANTIAGTIPDWLFPTTAAGPPLHPGLPMLPGLLDIRNNDAKIDDTKVGDAKIGDAKVGDAKIGDAKIGDAKIGDTKVADAKIGDAKIGDAGGGDAKVGDTKFNGGEYRDSKVCIGGKILCETCKLPAYGDIYVIYDVVKKPLKKIDGYFSEWTTRLPFNTELLGKYGMALCRWCIRTVKKCIQEHLGARIIRTTLPWGQAESLKGTLFEMYIPLLGTATPVSLQKANPLLEGAFIIDGRFVISPLIGMEGALGIPELMSLKLPVIHVGYMGYPDV